MATKILGFGDAFRALAAESGTMRGHPMMNTSVHYAIESDEDAALLRHDGNAHADAWERQVAELREAVAGLAELVVGYWIDEGIQEGKARERVRPFLECAT